MKYEVAVEDLRDKIIKCYNELSIITTDAERTKIRFKYGLDIFLASSNLEIQVKKGFK